MRAGATLKVTSGCWELRGTNQAKRAAVVGSRLFPQPETVMPGLLLAWEG
jgi:hypothetical protein